VIGTLLYPILQEPLCFDLEEILLNNSAFGSTDDWSSWLLSTSCDGDNSSSGSWFNFTGIGSIVTASTCSSVTTFDTKLSVFQGGCDGVSCLSCVAFNDDGYDCGEKSMVSFDTKAGSEYYIRVHGFGGATGDFELVLSETAGDT